MKIDIVVKISRADTSDIKQICVEFSQADRENGNKIKFLEHFNDYKNKILNEFNDGIAP